MSNPNFKAKFLETVQWYGQGLWNAQDTLALCVSGGVDSVVMLHAIVHLPKSLRPQVTVLHFDHALRGAQSAKEAVFVKKLCQKWGVAFVGAKAPAWKNKNNIHERARKLRYDFFFEQALKLGIKKILTAHHANDQAETFLMHWIHGAGLKGLAGIPMTRNYHLQGQGQTFTLMRPLLLMSRAEIEKYAKENRLKYCKDPSNQDQKYLRTRLRKLIVQIQKENPQFIERAAKNSLNLQEDEFWLNQATEKAFYEGMERVGESWQGSWEFFQGLPQALRGRLLQKIVYELCGESLSFDRIVSMIRFLETNEVDKTFLLPGMILKKEKKFFVFLKKTEALYDK